jgi:protein-S-isoprenylcysteine O-methyltransferase Ste14
MGLGLVVVYVLVPLGWTSARHRRRHGDLGWRLSSTTRTGRVASVVMTFAQGALGAAVIIDGRRVVVDAVTLVGVAVFAVGLLGVVLAQAAMGPSWRVGTDPDETTALVTDGLFRWVRNPIYAGMSLCLVGMVVASRSWVAAPAVILFVVGMELQVRLVEEPYLRRVHRDEFRAYEQRTGRFTPRLVLAQASR